MLARPRSLALLLFLCATTAQATPHFTNCSERTGDNATLIVPAAAVTLNGATLESGDEIAIYTPDGVCAGWTQWDGANTALSVWEDNPMTPHVDGFAPGEPIQYAIWDASLDTEYSASPVEIDYHPDYDDGVFQPDAVFLVSSLAAGAPTSNESGAPAEFALGSNYPNPFLNRTTIGYDLPHAASVTLEVYNLLGHRVGVLVDEVRQAGRHEVQFDADGIASGAYIYRLRAGDFTDFGKMTVVR